MTGWPLARSRVARAGDHRRRRMLMGAWARLRQSRTETSTTSRPRSDNELYSEPMRRRTPHACQPRRDGARRGVSVRETPAPAELERASIRLHTQGPVFLESGGHPPIRCDPQREARTKNRFRENWLGQGVRLIVLFPPLALSRNRARETLPITVWRRRSRRNRFSDGPGWGNISDKEFGW